MDKEELFIKRIRELANMAYQRDITTFTDFLNLNERNILNSQNFHKLGVTAESFGGYENAERQMVAFHSDALTFTGEYPIDCIRLEPKAVKFSEDLTHRDYLGAILNLGVDKVIIVPDYDYQEGNAQQYTKWLNKQLKLAKKFEGYCSVEIVLNDGRVPYKDNIFDVDRKAYEYLFERRVNISEIA